MLRLCQSKTIKKFIGGVHRYGLWRPTKGVITFIKIKYIDSNPRIISTVTDGLRIFFNYPEQFIITLTFFRELVEPEYEFLRSALSKKTIFFDIGAGIGTYTIFAGKFIDGPIHAFEPIKENIEMIKKNIKANSDSINVHLNMQALSNREGFGYIRKEANLFGSSLESVSQTYSENSIKVTTLDAYCKEHNVERIDIIKIDVEGHELAVLEGAREMLAKKKICIIILEDSINLSKIYDFLKHIKYEYYFFDYRDNSLLHIFPVNEETKNQLRPSIFNSNLILVQWETVGHLRNVFRIK